MQLLSTEPLILTIDDFLTDEECKHIINISKDRLNKARTCHYSKEEKKRVEDVGEVAVDVDDLGRRLLAL